MNSRTLNDNDDFLKFLVLGHIYGKPGDDEYHPSAPLVRNISLLKMQDPDFVILLGDTVWKPSEKNYNDLDLLILDPFEVPVLMPSATMT